MRRFKSKRRFNYKIIIFIILIISIWFITKVKINLNLENTNINVIKYLLNDTNSYIETNYKEYLFNSIFESYNPFNISIKNKTELVFNTSIKPRVYIYSTHDSEEYLDSNTGVRKASELLKDKLDSKDILTLVEKDSVSNYLKATGLNFYQSYKVSRTYLERTLKEYPDLDLIIDLHRDSVDRKYSYITINNKDYAKVLFVQGMRYDTYKDNMEYANKISDLINKKYPNLSKGLMLKDKDYQNPNFNQDLSTKAILLELGSNNNNWNEVCNTIDILSEVIEEVLNEKEG